MTKFGNQIFGSALLSVAVFLASGCSSDAPENVDDGGDDGLAELPLIMEPEKDDYRPIGQASFGTPFDTWLYDAENGFHLSSSEMEGIGRFRHTNSNPILRVVNRPIAVGDSLTFSATFRSTDNRPAQVRLLVARDCSLEPEEYTAETFWVIDTRALDVTHTFAQEYDCSKLQIEVLNASEDSPIYLDIYEPSFAISE